MCKTCVIVQKNLLDKKRLTDGSVQKYQLTEQEPNSFFQNYLPVWVSWDLCRNLYAQMSTLPDGFSLKILAKVGGHWAEIHSQLCLSSFANVKMSFFQQQKSLYHKSIKFGLFFCFYCFWFFVVFNEIVVLLLLWLIFFLLCSRCQTKCNYNLFSLLQTIYLFSHKWLGLQLNGF